MPIPFPKIKKMPKCRTKEDCVDLAKKITRAKGACECCGRLPDAYNPLDGAHIVPVRHSHTAADLRNLLCLRRDCHIYWTAHPLEFEEFVENKWPGRLIEMRQKARTNRGRPDWDSLHTSLTDEQKRLDHGNR